MLVCPICRVSLSWSVVGATCRVCSRTYPDDDGLLLFADGGEQAAYFDDAVYPEFEIERPHGQPRAYAWLLGEKFRLSIAGIEEDLADMTALAVCAGSGLDAEFLALHGAEVIAADVSPGAMRRARERARRRQFSLQTVVADTEHVPFADRSVDLAYVHDGLHHLNAPLEGLREMARVARRAVSVTEPADAAITKLAVRAGLALEREEAGNAVSRLRLDEVTGVLREEGFAIIRAKRYGMLYAHEPGWPVRVASSRPIFPLFRAALPAVNRIAGGLGNKLCVVAVRQ